MNAHPDADLIRACEEHRAAKDAFKRDSIGLDYPQCPAARRYLDAMDAVDAAPSAATMEGVTALALSALAEARCKLDGTEDWESSAAPWAGDVVKSLLHLQGIEA